MLSTPHCPFDRLWQPGHPFRPRRSPRRFWCMFALLIFSFAFIGSYYILTDSRRIKAMSQAYLSGLSGGQVEIGDASLTVFEGLKLSKVTLKVDDGKTPDSTLFTAETIEILYNPASLLRGQLDATRIIATGARVKLVEEAKLGHWNYQRLLHPASKPSATQPLPDSHPKFPELVLRDAQVQYGEMKGDVCQQRGSMAIEGHFFPAAGGLVYQFNLQSRGDTDGVGPVVSGAVTLRNGEINAKLSNLRFGHDIQAMLPRQVLDFWIAHRFEGSLDIPLFRFTPETRLHPATFKLVTRLSDVQMIIHSEEFTQTPLADIQPTPQLSKFPSLSKVDLTARQMFAWLHPLPNRPPIEVNGVNGQFTFDEKGIAFTNLTGTIAGATLVSSGKIDGYSPDAPIDATVQSLPGQLVDIPENPAFLPSLPSQVHQAFNLLKPAGTGTVRVSLKRALPNGLPQIAGEIDIVNGCFDCLFFPYPVHGATGIVRFGPDPTHTFERVDLVNIRGHGAPGGPNERAGLCINGWAGGDNPNVGCKVRAVATNMTDEPALFAAFPPPVRNALGIFKGPGDELHPHYSGDFDGTIFVPPGVNMRPIVTADVHFTDGSGKLVAFAYPLEHLTGDVHIGDGYLDVHNVNLSHGGTAVNVNGHVSWPVEVPPGQDPIVKPDLQLVMRKLPLDKELLKVLPSQARAWLRTVGASGLLDIDGHILPNPKPKSPEDQVGYDLNVQLSDGALKPARSDFTVNDLAGKLLIHQDRMQVLDLHGRREGATLAGTGTLNWSTGQPVVKLTGTADQLLLDQPLHGLLPEPARQAWEMLDPHGTVNAEISYQGTWSAPPGDALASLDTPGDLSAAPQPATTDDFTVTLLPTDVTVTPKPLPYQLDHCHGKLIITPRTVTVVGIDARHGDARIKVSGVGVTTDPNDWDLALSAENIPVDDQLRTALPLTLRQALEQLKYTGKLSVDLKTLRYRGDHPQPDLDLAGTLTATDGAVDVGVPVDQINGSVDFSAAVRGGKLAAFVGESGVDQMTLASRPAKNLKASLLMPAGSNVLSLTGIRGDIAGGELAGRMDLKFPDTGPASYLLDFQVKNADLREMARQVAPKGEKIRGLVSASFALQGDWADPTTRRGRGDVIVSGKQIYQIPLMLGLLEVTNLSLPTSNPFNEGSARYLVEGNRITFEQLQMRNSTVVMSGNGWLDFGSKQVRMNFTTENPNLPNLPIVHDLWEGAKNELLQIQVRGTVQAPTVSAAAMHTFTTSVDEVLSGSGKEK